MFRQWKVKILGSKRESVPAVILAGGRATRMGGMNKALVPLGGQPMLSLVINRLREQCGALAINANTEAEEFAAWSLPVLRDTIPGFPGPLAGILAGMEWAAAQGATAVVSVSVDTPFLPRDLVHRLREAAGRQGIALAASPDQQGRMRDHPTCGLWPVALAEDLAQAIESGLLRPGQYAAAHDPGRAVFDSRPFDPFTNINTPEDLRQAARLA